MINYEIYTDGAYSPSREQGGIGIVFVKNGIKVYEFSKSFTNTTNNRCELLAVIYALNSISKPIDSITIYTDSQYIIGGTTKGWERKKNIVLWRLYDHIYEKVSKLCSNISFKWIKGHSYSKFNQLADKLAVEASHEIA